MHAKIKISNEFDVLEMYANANIWNSVLSKINFLSTLFIIKDQSYLSYVEQILNLSPNMIDFAI